MKGLVIDDKYYNYVKNASVIKWCVIKTSILKNLERAVYESILFFKVTGKVVGIHYGNPNLTREFNLFKAQDFKFLYQIKTSRKLIQFRDVDIEYLNYIKWKKNRREAQAWFL